MDAASSIESDLGLSAKSASFIAMRSANVPITALAGRAYTSSPTLNRRTPGPTRTASPATSLPKISGIR
jgi:hypothetical protein